MLALEAGSFEITTAFAGALGVRIVSAHSTLLGICTYTFISFPFAVATAGRGGWGQLRLWRTSQMILRDRLMAV